MARAVLLDLYDTLVWSDWPQLRRMIEERAGLADHRLLDAFVRTRQQRSVGAFGSQEGNLVAVLEAAGLPDPALASELSDLTTTFLHTGVHLWDDSLPVVRELRRRGVATALVSNCDHGTRPVVDRLGLPDEMDAIVLSFEVGVAKPDAGIYQAALDALGARPEEAAFVDDQAAYCDGAAALGIESVLLVRPDASPDEGVSWAGSHRVIGDLRAVLDLV
ncbi:MAG: HAD family hydrolase [Actinobacteria bacterium]|nr:HAD family hydrolase [Actinomycetota bacterium]